jgi:hypothetical protein
VDVLPYPGPQLLMPCTHTDHKVSTQSTGKCMQTALAVATSSETPPSPSPPRTWLPSSISGAAAVGAVDAVPPWIALAEAALAHAAAIALIETKLQRQAGAGSGRSSSLCC